MIVLLVSILTLAACGETVADLQASAIADLDTALATYSESDYSADNYALITAAYDTAKSGINAVTDAADLPGNFVATFTAAADDVVTIAEQDSADAAALAAAKTSAIDALDTALATYSESDYSADNYASITAAYDTAKSGINAVTDVADLPGNFVATFTAAADDVVTIAEQDSADAEALAAAKATELALLDTALATYVESHYTADNYASITGAYNTAKSGINAVTDAADLPGNFVATFTAAADDVVTIAEQDSADAAALATAKATELALLDTALATYSESHYSADNYALITAAYDTAKSGINAVTDAADLPGNFVATFTDTADDVVTIAEQDSADAAALAAAKATELALLDTALATYVESHYTTDNYASITAAYNTAKSGINAVTDAADLPGNFVATFTAAADDVATIEEQAAALATAKTSAIADLDAELAKYDSDDYTTDNYASITAAYDTAKSAIESVTDIADLPGNFVAAFTAAADDVLTIVEQAALAAAKATELALLDTALDTYTESNYSVTNYALITAAYDTAKSAIESVTDIADLPGDFVSTFTATADDVLTIEEQAAAALATAKTSAIADLDTALATYSESHYTVDNYAIITTVYATAKSAIESVTDIADLPGNFVAAFTAAADDVAVITCTVTYDSDGGDEVQGQTVDIGNAFTVPTSPTYNQYVFVTWMLNGTEYDFDTVATGDITLVAQWTPTDGFTIVFNGTDGYTVTAYDGTAKIVTVPSTYDDGSNGELPVTAINGAVFKECSSLVSITIPSGVTSIGSSAFYGCSSLVSVSLPSTITSIGTYAFYGCSSLASMTIPSGVTSISNYAFYGCSSLVSVNLPSTIASIGTYAFNGCSSLVSVNLPSTITFLGTYAFYGCSSLESITIPNEVTAIGGFVFYGCSSLASITIPSGVTSIGAYAFLGCSSLASITIPSTITSIGTAAFTNCTAVSYVYYGGTAEQWFTLSFSSATISPLYASAMQGNDITLYLYDSEYGYYAPTTIDLSDSTITSIGAYSFMGISNVTTIILPSALEKIGADAFYGCSSLVSITIPSGTSIGSGAFDGCTSLVSDS